MWRISGVIDGVLVNALVEMVHEMAIRLLRRTTVETVCLLSREKVDGCIDIDLDVETIENKGGRATYAEIKSYVEGKYGLKVSSLYIGQIKDKVGMDKRLNYYHGSREGRGPNCPPEKEEAIMDAFIHSYFVKNLHFYLDICI